MISASTRFQVIQDALQTAYLAGLKDGLLITAIAAIILYLLFAQKD